MVHIWDGDWGEPKQCTRCGVARNELNATQLCSQRHDYRLQKELESLGLLKPRPLGLTTKWCQQLLDTARKEIELFRKMKRDLYGPSDAEPISNDEVYARALRKAQSQLGHHL